MAWLHAAPKTHEKEEDPKPRFKTLADGHPAKRLPEADEFLIECFKLSGFCMSGGMGVVPLTWGEIDAFVSRSGYNLSGFECELLIRMSRAYCESLDKSRKLHCPPPFQDSLDYDDEETVQQMRDRVAAQWESFGQGLKPSKTKRAL